MLNFFGHCLHVLIHPYAGGMFTSIKTLNVFFFFSTLSAKLNKLYSFNSLEKKLALLITVELNGFIAIFGRLFLSPNHTSQLNSVKVLLLKKKRKG